MNLKKASRKQAKINVLLSGPSGSGKTYSAILLASGIASFDKIALIDTERGSGELYCHLGEYNVLRLDPPYSPQRYIEAVNLCVKSGIECVIIDSISHEWEGVGGILDMKDHATEKNEFARWSKLTPLHNRFIEAIINCGIHVICTSRAKQDYILVEKNGKQTPEKVGMRSITREGFDYEVLLSFDLDKSHFAVSTKDRTGMFLDQPPFVITNATGKQILQWCNTGEAALSNYKSFLSDINNAKNTAELTSIQSKILDDKSLTPYHLEILRTDFVSKNNSFKKEETKKAV
jgi:hypothetical protein